MLRLGWPRPKKVLGLFPVLGTVLGFTVIFSLFAVGFWMFLKLVVFGLCFVLKLFPTDFTFECLLCSFLFCLLVPLTCINAHLGLVQSLECTEDLHIVGWKAWHFLSFWHSPRFKSLEHGFWCLNSQPFPLIPCLQMCFFTSNLLLRPLSHLVQSPNSKSDRLKPIKANCNQPIS